MKKIIALILTLTLALTLAACGGGGTKAPQTDPGAANSPAPGTSEPTTDSLVGEWLNRDADLYIAFFEDGWCVLARDGSTATNTYEDDGASLTLAGSDAELSTYSLADGKLTLTVDGTEYVFDRPAASPAIESGDYSTVPSDWSPIANYMEDALGDTAAAFEGGQQIYATDVITFSVPAELRRWAYISDVTEEKTNLTFYGGDVEVKIQCGAHWSGYSTVEELLAEFAEDYPDAEINTVKMGANGEYEMVCRTLPSKPEYLLGRVYVQEAGDAGYTGFTIEVWAEEEGVTGPSIWNDSAFVQAILNSLVFNYA